MKWIQKAKVMKIIDERINYLKKSSSFVEEITELENIKNQINRGKNEL